MKFYTFFTAVLLIVSVLFSTASALPQENPSLSEVQIKRFKIITSAEHKAHDLLFSDTVSSRDKKYAEEFLDVLFTLSTQCTYYEAYKMDFKATYCFQIMFLKSSIFLED